MIDLQNIQRTDFQFWTNLETRWRDMDVIGHLNHTAYLTYMESSRVELYTQLGYPGLKKEMDQSAILASLQVNYYKQASHPSQFDIGNKISRIGGKSYDILSAIFHKNQDTVVCVATFKMVAFNYKNNKAINVPDLIVEAYRKGK